MKILTTSADVQKYLSDFQQHNKTIGFVPTMGALHKGHLTLIEKCVSENDIAVCSVFVNPTQFNNPDDFKKYPSTIDKDIELLKKAKVDVAFIPATEDIYPEGTENLEVPFDLGYIDEVMEGQYRPGHFKGVAIVVKRLFDIVQPSKAYFGEKDFQQLLLVKKMVKTLKLPIQIIGVPTVREKSGLALSSRNLRLSQDGKRQALYLYKALIAASEKIDENTSIQTVKNEVIHTFFQNNDKIQLEYFEIVDEETLQPLSTAKKGQKIRLLIAAYVDNVRLIDNIGIIA